eukprot:TRINITY_DN3023_c0_g3_i2.p1 TRINITY_DN3023_c0_g3~~TRINITY_DN3023_c0_g3_i2.p1  ORF type:complete len:108 (-),score=5.84 TRINITY_DN3023_c0_g3_i2:408-731(-)
MINELSGCNAALFTCSGIFFQRPSISFLYIIHLHDWCPVDGHVVGGGIVIVLINTAAASLIIIFLILSNCNVINLWWHYHILGSHTVGLWKFIITSLLVWMVLLLLL